jgi:two-component system osmolarity sensor histidine kinase EnvZ
MMGKYFLPSSLFGRALLILLLPTVLIQAVMAYIFFDRHWEYVARNMSKALAGEIVFLVDRLQSSPPGALPAEIKAFDAATDLDIMLDKEDSFSLLQAMADYPEFQETLRARIDRPFTVRKNEGIIDIRIALTEAVLHIEAPAKRLESPTTFIFVLWMLGITFVFLLIAVIFLRNQIRPIRKLAQAADSFGRGVELPDFKPSGATEVRTASRAFIIMRERIKRQLRTRTDMLAGISHDLRTPLTRMKLQLAMLGDREETQELKDDVQQMEHMIGEYLDFARGDTREDTAQVSVRELLEEVVANYRRSGADVRLEIIQDSQAELRLLGFTRMLHNLVDNAVRYGARCRITLKTQPSACEILVDDEGSGIPKDKYEEVFQPFRRLDPSRNVNIGGVGLGLTIARDIVLSHGGSIALDRSPEGGLRVIVRLPLTRGLA